VHYPTRAAPLAPHGALGDCLAKWAKIANLGSLGTEARIKALVTSDRPLSIEDEDFLKQSLLDISTLRYFTQALRGANDQAKESAWGRWIERYRRRWKVERLFAWMHNFRRLVTRWEYHIENFLGFVHLACLHMFLGYL